jgi:hypothetical protein
MVVAAMCPFKLISEEKKKRRKRKLHSSKQLGNHERKYRELWCICVGSSAVVTQESWKYQLCGRHISIDGRHCSVDDFVAILSHLSNCCLGSRKQGPPQ